MMSGFLGVHGRCEMVAGAAATQVFFDRPAAAADIDRPPTPPSLLKQQPRKLSHDLTVELLELRVRLQLHHVPANRLRQPHHLIPVLVERRLRSLGCACPLSHHGPQGNLASILAG